MDKIVAQKITLFYICTMLQYEPYTGCFFYWSAKRRKICTKKSSLVFYLIIKISGSTNSIVPIQSRGPVLPKNLVYLRDKTDYKLQTLFQKARNLRYNMSWLLAELRNNREDADVTLHCQGEVIMAHSSILKIRYLVALNSRQRDFRKMSPLIFSLSTTFLFLGLSSSKQNSIRR